MSSENCKVVHQERDRLEQLFDEYFMRVNDLKNEPDSYKGTLSYREAYDECLYNHLLKRFKGCIFITRLASRNVVITLYIIVFYFFILEIIFIFYFTSSSLKVQRVYIHNSPCVS